MDGLSEIKVVHQDEEEINVTNINTTHVGLTTQHDEMRNTLALES